MKKKGLSYISFDEFVRNADVKESTIKCRYKEIHGLIKEGNGFKVLSGTRYPYNVKTARKK